LANEEENGEDSEMIDAMEGWDSDQDDQNREGGANPNANGAAEGGSGAAGSKTTANAASKNADVM
jgi:hypothetical protein